MAGPVAGQRRRRGRQHRLAAPRNRVAAARRRRLPKGEERLDALGSAILVLISGDVIRPSLSWLLTPGTVQMLTTEMALST